MHLKAFGNVPHVELWKAVHFLLEVDGANTGVDSHGGWHWSKVPKFYFFKVRACRKLLIGHENLMGEVIPK